ncbi:betaine--homocysteine S-methyltransferase 1-like [Haliotis cracherodii]|uniref:betaine--homocysteine S-methyltransferase 1-like n=1 Tax=Haliotis cracherodii TaxID=6455 RepID=UPI0039E9EB86
MMPKKGLLERLQNGGNVIMAEGFVFEFERRGYLRAGPFVPEVVLDYPHLVRSLSEEFVHAGSEVVLAFTYYGHREKLRLIGKEHLLEKLNKDALKIAKEVADESGTLMAGNICNTTVYRSNSPEHIKQAEAIFKEQIEWAVEYDADFILAETFPEFGEALLALESIKKYGKAMENVFTCAFQGPIAAFPVPYRTSKDVPVYLSLIDPFTGKRAFPDVSSQLCGVAEITAFAKECKEIGVQVIGVCCGNTPAMTRAVAEVYGRTPPASKFSPFMEKHYIFGKDKSDYFSDDYYLSNMSAAVSKAP